MAIKKMKVLYETEFTDEGEFVLWLMTGTEKQHVLKNPSKDELQRADEMFELEPLTKWDEESFKSYTQKVMSRS